MVDPMFDFLRTWFRSVPLLHGDHGPDDETDDDLSPPLIVRNGWLEGEGIEHIPSLRTQALASIHVEGMMWHWTATRGNARGLARAIRKRPGPTERSASWHLLIPREGPMFQSAPTTVGTWHAGGKTAARFVEGPDGWWVIDRSGKSRLSANGLFFSVELENAGQVMEVEHQYLAAGRPRPIAKQWRSWPFGGNAKVPRLGPVIPAEEVMALSVDGRVRYYHEFTTHQVAQSERVVRAIHAAYPNIPRSAFEWTHKMVDGARKHDPEPAWNPHRNAILDRVF